MNFISIKIFKKKIYSKGYCCRMIMYIVFPVKALTKAGPGTCQKIGVSQSSMTWHEE